MLSRKYPVTIRQIVLFSFLAWFSFNTGQAQISIYLQAKAEDPKLQAINQALKLSISNQLHQPSEVKVYDDTDQIDLPTQILQMDKVQLLNVRRTTGFDGLIRVATIDPSLDDNLLTIQLDLVGFSAGQIVFSHQLEGTFGADLLSQVEAKVSSFLQTLVHYYDAKLSIISDPIGAEVWVDGRNLGQTPTGNLTIAANQQLNLAIKKKGYLTYNRVIEVQSGQYTLIHALLYDRITDQLLKQQRHLDSMNFSLGSQFYAYDLGKIGLKTQPAFLIRYLSKFDRWQIGVDLSSANWEGIQQFDTVLGTATGQSNIDFQLTRFSLLGQYNLLERINQFDLYTGLQVGLANTLFDYQRRPTGESTLTETSAVNPVVGFELGGRFYFGYQFKLESYAGAELGGKATYYQKVANYWGASTYQPQIISLNRLYFGAMLTYSFWPKHREIEAKK